MLVLVANSLKPPVSQVPQQALAGWARSSCTAKLRVAPGAKAGPATAHPDTTCHRRLSAEFAAAQPDVSIRSRKSRLDLSSLTLATPHVLKAHETFEGLVLIAGARAWQYHQRVQREASLRGVGVSFLYVQLRLIFGFWCKSLCRHGRGRNVWIHF